LISRTLENKVFRVQEMRSISQHTKKAKLFSV